MGGWMARWVCGWVEDGQLGVGGQMGGWTDGLEECSAVAARGSPWPHRGGRPGCVWTGKARALPTFR